MAKEKTEWGTVKDTGAGAMDLVIRGYPIGREFTEGELESDIRVRSLKTRGAMESHLNTLRKRGYIQKALAVGGWRRIK